MERKTTQRWQLQDLLHAVGEEGITQSDYGDTGGDPMQARVDPIDARLLGAVSKKTATLLDINAQTGLPENLTANEKTYMWRAITTSMRGSRGSPPTLTWVEPITCSVQMKMSLEDKQVHVDDDRRFRTVTLRSRLYFQGRPARDNVKVWVEMDAGPRLYFAMYVAINLAKYLC